MKGQSVHHYPICCSAEISVAFVCNDCLLTQCKHASRHHSSADGGARQCPRLYFTAPGIISALQRIGNTPALPPRDLRIIEPWQSNDSGETGVAFSYHRPDNNACGFHNLRFLPINCRMWQQTSTTKTISSRPDKRLGVRRQLMRNPR